MKKYLLILSLISMLLLVSCGSNSKEAKELLQKILNLVGIPQSIVINVCQDENRDGICNVFELQAKVNINKINDDTLSDIWVKIKNTAEGKYLLETYDSTLPLLLELQDTKSQHYTNRFTIPFSGLKVTEKEKDLSILQAMVDADYLTSSAIASVAEIKNKDKFYTVLLKDFEINLNTLEEQNISSPRAVLANLEEVATELKDAGIEGNLTNKINACEDDETCIDDALDETIIRDDEVSEIQTKETKATKKLFAGKTLYAYFEENSTKMISEVIIDKDATSWNYKGIVGTTNSGIESIEIEGDKLTIFHPEESTPDVYSTIAREKYISLINTKDNSEMKFFANRADAENDLAEDNGGDSNMKFTFPSNLYTNVKKDYNGQDSYKFEAEKFAFSSDKKFTYSELYFKNSSFVFDEEDNSNQSFRLENGQWVKEQNEMTIVVSENDKVVTLDNFYKFRFQSLKELGGKSIKAIDNSDITVVMPQGAKKIELGLEVLKDNYGIDRKADSHGNTESNDYSSLSEVVKEQCGNRYFTHAKDNSGIRGIAFTCDQEEQTSGTLVGVKDDNSLVTNGIGTWEIKNLPDSKIKALLVNINKKYNENTDSPMYAIKDGEVWRGWADIAGKKEPIISYNQKALDAISAKLKDLNNND